MLLGKFLTLGRLIRSCAVKPLACLSTTSSNMAKSKFEYVRSFETDDSCLRNCYIVVRLDGRNFHKWVSTKKNVFFITVKTWAVIGGCICYCCVPGLQSSTCLQNPMTAEPWAWWPGVLALSWETWRILSSHTVKVMSSALFLKGRPPYSRGEPGTGVCLAVDTHTHVSLFAHCLHAFMSPSCSLHSKLMTHVTSQFSSSYVFYWKDYFGDQPLLYPPGFDGRVVLYPTNHNLRDYLSWRQADCKCMKFKSHIWCLDKCIHLTTTVFPLPC